jgi:hypothetical protein
MIFDMLFCTHLETNMPKKRITITVDEPVAEYLAGLQNTSAIVCEAVREYHARELEKVLEAAYQDSATESAEINAEWEPTDTEVEE